MNSIPDITAVLEVAEKVVPKRRGRIKASHLATGGGGIGLIFLIWTMFLAPMGDRITAGEAVISSVKEFVAAQAVVNMNMEKIVTKLADNGQARDTTINAIKDAVLRLAILQEGKSIALAKKKEPVIKFVFPSIALPIGTVLKRGDTTWIATMDTVLVADNK